MASSAARPDRRTQNEPRASHLIPVGRGFAPDLLVMARSRQARPVAFFPCGCGPGPAKPVLAKPVAPVRPAEVKAETLPSVKFVDITKDAGIAFVHDNGALGEKLLPETMGAGVAFLDYDNDGDQDLLFVNSSSLARPRGQAGAHAGPLSQRRQGPLRGCHQAGRSRQDVLRTGGSGRRLRQRRRPRPIHDGDRRRPSLPQRRQGALRGRDRGGQRQGA